MRRSGFRLLHLLHFLLRFDRTCTPALSPLSCSLAFQLREREGNFINNRDLHIVQEGDLLPFCQAKNS